MQFDPRFGGRLRSSVRRPVRSRGGFDPRGGGDADAATAPQRPAKSVAIAVDAKANSVTITAPPEKIAAAKKIIEEFDKGNDHLEARETRSCKKYSVPAGTADAIAKTLLVDNPSLRIIAVQAANEIWVMATPDEHFKLMGKIKDSIQPGARSRRTEIIRLSHSDPAEMVTKLVKLLPERQRRADDRGRLARHAVHHREGHRRADQGDPGYRSRATRGPRPAAVPGPCHPSRSNGGCILPEGSASVLAERLGEVDQQDSRQPGHHPGPERPAEGAGAVDAGREGSARAAGASAGERH